MKNRRTFWIQPAFQRRVIFFWTAQALAVALCAYFITTLLAERSVSSDLVFLVREAVRPAVLVSAVAGFVLSVLAGILFSHRIAGPVHRIKTSIDRIIGGKFAEPIVLRQDDELKDLAASINLLLQYLWLQTGTKGKVE